jgi:hypothetical protein
VVVRVGWFTAVALGCAAPASSDLPTDAATDDGVETDVETDAGADDTDDRPDDSETDGRDTGTPRDPDEALRALGPSLWVRAADLVVAGTVNGDPVALWAGVDGVGATAAQPRRFRQPSLRFGLASPVPVVRFDGIDDRLDVPMPPLASDRLAEWTVVVALRVRGDGHVVGSGLSEPRAGRPEGARVLVRGGAVTAIAAADANGLVVPSPERVADDAFRVVSVVVRPKVSSVFVDGRLTWTSDRSPNPFPHDAVTIGASDGEGIDAAVDPLDGDLAELFVVPRALPACERWLVESRLGAGVGVAPSRDVLPAFFRYVADDAGVADGATVSEVPSRAAPGLVIGPLRALVGGAGLPQLAAGAFGAAGALRFDGVDDRLDLPISLVSGDLLGPSTTFVVFRTADADGVLLGTAPSAPGSTATRAAGLLVEDGRVGILTRTADGEAGARAASRVDDGQPHVVTGTLSEVDVTVWLDGVSAPGAGRPRLLGEARASLGAADGQAIGAAVDPLAVEVAEIRQYRYVLDACGRSWVERELAAGYGIAVP